MSVSRHVQIKWGYRDDAPDDDFDKRMGTILSRGRPFVARPTTAPAGGSTKRSERRSVPRAQSAAPRRETPPTTMNETGISNVTENGYGWVAEDGKVLVEPSEPTKAPKHVTNKSASVRPSTCMPSNRRTQEMWKRTNPGIMEQFISTPISSTQEQFQYREELLDLKTRTNWLRHRTKTSFSEYVEADARLAKLIRARGAAGI